MAIEKKIKKRKTVDTWKKKEWYSIAAPKVFEEKEIGTTIASDESSLMNRILNVPLREITNNMNHQYIKLRLRVTEIKGKTAHTAMEGFDLVPEYLRRNVRRHRSIVKLVKDGVTKDGQKIRITAHIFTGRKIDTTKKDEIRKLTDVYLAKEIQENTAETLIQKCVFGTTPTEILKAVKIVSPIKRVEVSKMKFVRGK
ncbi:hypothetical protein H0N95_01325 [Candidatus Micrarchaeota archaeon]|nr:hypothetical protein [Candidatus Micrarchaeota archaeon]